MLPSREGTARSPPMTGPIGQRTRETSILPNRSAKPKKSPMTRHRAGARGEGRHSRSRTDRLGSCASVLIASLDSGALLASGVCQGNDQRREARGRVGGCSLMIFFRPARRRRTHLEREISAACFSAEDLARCVPSRTWPACWLPLRAAGHGWPWPIVGALTNRVRLGVCLADDLFTLERSGSLVWLAYFAHRDLLLDCGSSLVHRPVARGSKVRTYGWRRDKRTAS